MNELDDGGEGFSRQKISEKFTNSYKCLEGFEDGEWLPVLKKYLLKIQGNRKTKKP
jgi:hypothetical protein